MTKPRVVMHLAWGFWLGLLTAGVLFLIVLLWGAAVVSLIEGPTGAAWQAWVYAATVPLGPVVVIWTARRLAARQRARLVRIGVEVEAARTSYGRQILFHLYAIAVDVPAGLLVVEPRTGRRVAELDARVGRALLGPSRAETLTRRVATLARSRDEIIEATDAERRRIERDLHDGVQQRLVSMAMNLGMARATLPESPEREAIDAAHDEAVAALAELRDFVRGLHPAVLDARGLDAAISGIAARAPLPVRVTVDVEPRCAPGIEGVAYFVVSEALANVAKHASATSAGVTLTRSQDRLIIDITDDGRGGAVITSDSGLAKRAAGVDGTLTVTSPPGGPTSIVVELPCA
ncbi:histidine kinase [Actinoplanes sp. NPDC051470]|uniref:sensor histidine kinase n=1 Tax=Actinoplanes sp. NPDC051470 TaxID=3157224 RepID=UPI003431AEDF